MPSNGFCPKCGAVMYQGVCPSCGYTSGGRKQAPEQTAAYSFQEENGGGRFSGNAGGTSTSKSTGSSHTGVIAAIILAAVIFVMLVFVYIIVIFMGVAREFDTNITNLPEEEIQWDYDADATEDPYVSDYDQEEYIPSPSDDFYETIVSTTVRGLNYDIMWDSGSIFYDDADVAAVFYYYYPVIVGDDRAFVDDINKQIRDKALSYVPEELPGEAYGYVDCYITYMSEEMLSVVYNYVYEDKESVYTLSALNFDMQEGRVLSAEEMLPDYDFVLQFRNNCEKQNGFTTTQVLNTLSDQEVEAAIKDPQRGVIFYSPVGLELGINYEYGWFTATMKGGVYQ